VLSFKPLNGGRSHARKAGTEAKWIAKFTHEVTTKCGKKITAEVRLSSFTPHDGCRTCFPRW
jgi:hypothetical protein